MDLSCSFCGKSSKEVRALIAGPCVQICDECVELCADIAGSDDPANPKAFAPRIHVAEERVNGAWKIWMPAKSEEDSTHTVSTLRRCNPDKRFRTAQYVRITTGSES